MVDQNGRVHKHGNQNAAFNCDRIYLSAENKHNPGFSISLCTSYDLFGMPRNFGRRQC